MGFLWHARCPSLWARTVYPRHNDSHLTLQRRYLLSLFYGQQRNQNSRYGWLEELQATLFTDILKVYTIFFLDTLQTCMTGADAFYWFCSGFGDLTHLSNVYISFFDTPMLGGLMALIVQSFFCYRIWVLSKSNVIPVVLWLVSVIFHMPGRRSHVLTTGLLDVLYRCLVQCYQSKQIRLFSSRKILYTQRWTTGPFKGKSHCCPGPN